MRSRTREDGVVGLHDGVGGRAAPGSVHARGGYVDAAFGDARGDVREHAALVALADDHAGVLARYVDVDSVDAGDEGRSAPDAHAAHLKPRGVGLLDDDVDGVGVIGVLVGIADERDVDASVTCDGERVAYLEIARIVAEQAGDERLVGAVPRACVRERAVEGEGRACGSLRAQASRHLGDGERSCGVGWKAPP